MRIRKSDSLEVRCAKKAAMISMYAMHNPLHVFFEDGNVHRGPMNFERNCNDQYRNKNGKLMYEFIREFLNEFEELPPERRWPVYRLYRKKLEYLARKWRKKRVEAAGEKWDRIYQMLLAPDGHIYFKMGDIQLLAF